MWEQFVRRCWERTDAGVVEVEVGTLAVTIFVGGCGGRGTGRGRGGETGARIGPV